MATVTLTRIAHSSVLLDFDGAVILTDPWFSEKPGYHHGEPYGVTLNHLPPLTGVIASHGHYDHFDMQGFQPYPNKAVPIVVKREKGEMAKTARQVGFTNLIELEAWEATMLGPVKVTALPAKHGVPEITYMLERDGLTVYFGGDTLFIPELRAIPAYFPSIDLALLAVNGLEIRPLGNKKVVMDAQDAAAFCALLQPRYAVPMHYTFTGGTITDHLMLKYTGTVAEFLQSMAVQAPQTLTRVLAPGEALGINSRIPE